MSGTSRPRTWSAWSGGSTSDRSATSGSSTPRSRPRSSAFGADAYPSIELKAAALLHSLGRNHALADGNKRLGWLAAVVFLDVNDHSVDIDDDDAFDLVTGVADGRIGVEEITDRLRSRRG